MPLVNIMFKKFITIFIASILLLTCFSGCKNDEEIYLSCAVDKMPRYFDPQVADNTAERIVAVNTFDGLFKLDENGQVQKCVVKDYNISSNGLVYTFYLRDDAKYFISQKVQTWLEEKGVSVSDKVTAKDFVFGITRAVMPQTNAPDYDLLGNIKNAEKVHNGELPSRDLGIRAINDYTLEITLEKKSSDFLYALTQPITFPCNEAFFNLTGGRYGLDREYIISNGSFYLSDIKDDESVRFTKNEEYSGEFAALPTSVRLYVNVDEVEVAKKVDDGTYSIGVFTMDKAIEKLGRKITKTNLSNITTSLIFNMSKENFKNTNLRQGLVYGIDVASITENSTKNLITDYYNLSGGKVDGLTYNKNNAKKKMIAGFKELGIEKITVNILCTEEYQDMAKAVINSWQTSIGVELNGTVTVATADEFRTKINSGDFDTAIYPLVVDSNQTKDFLEMFYTEGSENIFGYSSEEYDRQFVDMISGETKAKALSCESYLLTNAIVLPLQHEDTVIAVAKGVSGIYFAGDNANVYFYKGQKK